MKNFLLLSVTALTLLAFGIGTPRAFAQAPTESECKVTDARFDTASPYVAGNYKPTTSSGKTIFTPVPAAGQFYMTQPASPQARLLITTTGCQGKKIEVGVFEDDYDGTEGTIETQILSGLGILASDESMDFPSNGSPMKIFPPDDGNLVITVSVGTHGCDWQTASILNSVTPVVSTTCEYNIIAGPADGTKAENIFNSNDEDQQNEAIYSLEFACPGSVFGGCWTDIPWKLISTNGNSFQAETNAVTPSGPCAKPDGSGYDPTCYEFVSDFPFVDEFGNIINKIQGPTTVGGFANTLFQMLIGVAGVLAVIMVIYHAWTYLTTDSISEKVLLKDKLLKVLLGLVLLLGAYVILRTINPNLLNLEPNIETLSIDNAEGHDTLYDQGKATELVNLTSQEYKDLVARKKSRGTTSSGERQGLVNSTTASGTINYDLNGKVNIKNETLAAGSRYISQSMGPKILALVNDMKSRGIEMRVTEAFPPTYMGHKSKCHYVGTCIDISFGTAGVKQTASETTNNIKYFISKASSLGLLAQWEYTDNSATPTYAAAGIPKGFYLDINVATHFSLYDLN